MTRIGIIERNSIFSRNYAEFLEGFSDYAIAFQAAAIGDLKAGVVDTCNADVIILDLPTNETMDLEGIAALRRYAPRARLILFTSRADIRFIIDCLKTGIDGYLLKTEGLFALHEAIKIILKDGLVISPTITRQLISHIFSARIAEIPLNFTNKEKEILYLVQQGLSYKEMADELKVTSFTINHHLKKIYKKGGVNSRSQLMVLLQKHKSLM